MSSPNLTARSVAGDPSGILWQFMLLIAGLVIVAYLPCINNGFISDDFIILERVEEIKHDLLSLIENSPEIFRATSFLCFGILKKAFGYHYEFYYAFTILLHIGNCLLLRKVVFLVSGSTAAAWLTAVLFAVFQNPQEGIMWLIAMNEELQALCLLGAVYLWIREHFLWSSLAYSAGLFSKESGLIILIFIPLVELFAKGRLVFRRQFLYLVFPTLIFAGIFVYTIPQNTMVHSGLYAGGFHAVRVLGYSLHRLAFPWAYLAAAALMMTARRLPVLTAAKALAWMTIGLLPYIFLNYQNHVPSRQEYLASMGLVWMLAEFVTKMGKPYLRNAFVVSFVCFNIGYLWLVKDHQFERRAAPTRQLIVQLRSHAPAHLTIIDFPLNPWIARMTTRLVPGWTPEMIRVNEPAKASDSVRLRWDPASDDYRPFCVAGTLLGERSYR